MLIELKLPFCLLLLTSIVHGRYDLLRNRLTEMAGSGELVAGEFRPYPDGFPNQGASGYMCNGERAFDEKPIALKFVQNKEIAEREYEMYTYLEGVERDIERFGFSNVHYYTEWEGYYLIVLSYFDDGNLISKAKDGFLKTTVSHDAINGLLLFRNFVRQSKYMHSHGIRHDNIRPESIMLRMGQSFLVNFNSGSKMYEDNHCGTAKYASRAYHEERIRTALDDWESFLYSMCQLHNIQLAWFSDEKQLLNHKFMTNITISTIQQTIRSHHLREVFLEFAGEIFIKKHAVPYPNYDSFDKFVTDQINNLLKPNQYELFSWISPASQFLEMEKRQLKPKLNIKRDIKFPKSLNFETFKYPAVNVKHFTEVNFAKSVSVLFRSCVEGSAPIFKKPKL